jgi:hypothetical protein
MKRIETEAEICPSSIKIPLKALSKGEKGREKVWKLVSHFYLNPFLKVANNE